jgi:hypothetical protein
MNAEDLIVKAYTLGRPVVAICRAADISEGKLYDLLHHRGVPLRRPPGAVSLQQQVEALMLAGHAEGRWVTTDEAMRATGASKATVLRVRSFLVARGALRRKGEYGAGA